MSNDLWLDPYTTLGSETYFDDITKLRDELNPPVVNPEPTPDPAPVEDVSAAPVSEPEEENLSFPVEGGVVRMEHTSKGWCGTLEYDNNSKPEVFYGKTKNELIVNVLKGKLHATKAIQELNRKVKLGEPKQTAPAPNVPPPPSTQARSLTADEIYKYKELLQTDPVAAQDFYNEIRYGMNPDEFATRLDQIKRNAVIGRDTNIENIGMAFVNGNPDYYPTPANHIAVVQYLTKKYLGYTASGSQLSQAQVDLYERNVWNLQELEAAKDELLEDGLLQTRPAAPRPEPPAVATPTAPPLPTPTPAAPVVQQPIPAPTVRTRAGNFGIRPVESPSAATAPETSLPVEDFSRLSDAQLDEAMKSLRQSRMRQR